MTVVVVGDLMADVVAWASAPLAHASDTPAQVTMHPGGGGANVAARLAELGVPVLFVARAGDDAAGRATLEGLRRAGVETQVAIGRRDVTLLDPKALPPGQIRIATWDVAVAEAKCRTITLVARRLTRDELFTAIAGVVVRPRT